MLDVSFSELVLILIVGLLVFGPEKLPEVVRTAGMWIGKMRRSFAQIRSDIEREVGVDELKRDFHNNSIMESLKDVQSDLQQTQRELQQMPYDVGDVVRRNNTPAASIDPVEHSVSADAVARAGIAPAPESTPTAKPPLP